MTDKKCCGVEAVYVDNVPGKEYLYCRQCKQEVVEVTPLPERLLTDIPPTGVSPNAIPISLTSFESLVTRRGLGHSSPLIFSVALGLDISVSASSPVTTSTCSISFKVPKYTGYFIPPYDFFTGFKNVTCATQLLGVMDWVPDTVPKNDNFLDVNHSIDETRLAGTRYSRSFRESNFSAINNLIGRMTREGASPDHVFMNPADLPKGSAPVDELVRAYGRLKVCYDNTVMPGTAFALTMWTWVYDPAFNLVCLKPSENGIVIGL